MPSFTDNQGTAWELCLDAFTLGELRESKKIDLADPAGLDYARCERDPSTLVAALAAICADERKKLAIDERAFAKRLTGESIERATEALLEAAKLFFPARLWSALESNLESHRQLELARPMMMALEQPGITAEMRGVVMEQVSALISSGSLPPSGTIPSALGQDATPSSSASEPPAVSA